MIRLTGKPMEAALALAVLAAASAPAAAQDYVWVETRFHRVYLHNGNFIDGNVLGVSGRDVQLRLPAGEMTIRKDTIERIELMKMRSILEKPKLDPPLKKSSAGAGTVTAPSRLAARDFPPAEVSEEMASNVAACLSRLKIARPDQKDDLVQALSRMENVSPYLASLLPTLEEEPCYLVRSALVRAHDAEALPYLLRALESDRAYVQIHALTLIGLVGSVRVAPSIRPFLMNSTGVVKATAIETLQQLHDADSLDLIADMMADEDATLRVPAITAALDLALQFDRMDVISDRLRRNLAGSQGRVARELLGAAARSRRPELWEPVSPFLTDPDPVLRRIAASTLASLATTEAAGVIKTRLQMEDDPRTLVELARAAVKLRTLVTVPALIDLLARPDENVVKGAADALTALTNEKFGDNRDRWLEWMDRNSSK